MKKIILLVTVAVVLFSCNKLGKGDYIITKFKMYANFYFTKSVNFQSSLYRYYCDFNRQCFEILLPRYNRLSRILIITVTLVA
jgi:hypothetical protein